jgi:LacI family transcriptional regulator
VNVKREICMVDKRVKLADIAKQLGLSTATVSLALRNNESVALDTRKLVQEAAKQGGYIYNRTAAAIRTGSSGMVAVGFNDITNPYFAELLEAIEGELRLAHRSILLGNYNDDLTRQAAFFKTITEYRPDGVIFCPAAGTKPVDLAPLIEQGIPFVLVSRYVEGLECDVSRSDDVAGAELAFEYLIQKGHKHIALIGGYDDLTTGKHRRETYEAVMKKHGLMASYHYEGLGTRELGVKAIDALLKNEPRLTAAFCFNDITAFGAMLALKRHGRDDFALIGCDDVKEAALWSPALTTVSNHQYEMGRKAAQLLLARIATPDKIYEHITIAPELILRGTA